MMSGNNKDKIGNIVGDLRVLSDKCNRDVDRKYPFNYRYYLKELNRIIVELKQVQPEMFQDMNVVEDAKQRSLSSGAVTGQQDAKLREISAVADKLLSRLTYQETPIKPEPISTVENIFDRFHQIARQLRGRFDDRPTLDVKDEYDVQDLLHSLLKLYFNDIRPEEWTPSYAGSSSRMDFLLKDERLVIEVKRTRDSLRDKQIGEQLIVDITKYKEHPDCKTLVCFVYDPDGLIANPTGLENDLSKLSTSSLTVKVCIFPKY